MLLAAEGLNNSTIAKKLDISRLTVGTWRRRFAKKRLDGLMTSRVLAPRANLGTTRSPRS